VKANVPESTSSSDKSKADQGIAERALPANVGEVTADEAIEKKDQSEPASQNANKPSITWRVRRIPGDWWNALKETENTNRAIAIATIVIAIATVFTWWEAHSGSKQTDKIIVAANAIKTDQNQLVLDNRQVLQDNRDALNATLKENRKEVSSILRENRASLKAQTQAAHEQSVAALQSALSIQQQTIISERPWLSVDFEPIRLRFVNGMAALDSNLSITNVGKSIAKEIQIEAKMIPTKAMLVLDAGEKQGDLCSRPQLIDITGVGFDLFPSNEPTVRQIGTDVRQADIDAQSVKVRFPDGKIHAVVGFYVVGCVVYHYSFANDLHETRFAYHLIAPPVPLPNGSPLFNVFEVGVDVPQGKFGKIAELFGANDAF
jgi:ElaB/YqjD/DUF883 family membrane-anchored ribosome-binding protein